MEIVYHISHMKKVAIIGAGISGLACAYELHKAGYDVEVYEKEAYVGGRLSTRVKDRLPFDIGVNHFINLYEEMRHYADELGLDWHPFNFVNYKLALNGEVVDLMSTLTRREKIKLALAYKKFKKIPPSFLNASTLVAHDTNEISAYEYARKIVGPHFAEDLVDTYVGVYQFHRATEISKAALMSQMNSIHSFQNEWYLQRTKGGMIAIPEAIAKKVTVHLETPVYSVVANEDSIIVDTKHGEKEYDHVVLATTATIARKIYKNPTPAQDQVMAGAKYASSILAAFTMPANTFGPPDAGDGSTVSAVWIPFEQSQLLSSYSNESEKGEELIVDGKTLLIAFFREEGADKYMDASDNEIYEVANKEVQRLCPFVDETTLEPYDIYRWKEAMPKFYPGSIAQVAEFLELEQGAQQVWLAGDYLNAPWSEGALRCGKRVAEEIKKVTF